MSRWLPDRAVLRLGDEPQIAPEVSMCAVREPPAPGANAETRATDLLIGALEREIDGRSLQPGTRLTCVIAGEAARYCIVPWNADLSRPLQRQLYAEHCFREVYGDVVRHWTVRVQPHRHGTATLGCAIDTLLLDRLSAMAQARRMKLVGIQPSLMHAFNGVRRRVTHGAYWFLWIERDWTIALLMAGAPVHVKRVPMAQADPTLLLDREWFSLGMDLPRCPVYIARSSAATQAGTSTPPPAAAPQDTKWHFVELGLVSEAVPPAELLPIARQLRPA